MVALLQESGDGEVSVPPTIQTLLAARLDQLDPRERNVLQRASVEGRLFHRGAVQALSPDETRLTARLTALVRKELIRPDTAQLPDEDAFRFRHLLSRDAAYDALPKSTRADLHERFAGWLTEHGAGVVELDELRGYHLERASRFKRELGQPDGALAGQAATSLGVAGRRAFDRGDTDAARNLLGRAAALLEDGDPARLELEAELGDALLEGGRLAEAELLLQQTVARATGDADRLLQARALVGLSFVRAQTQAAQAQAQIESDVEPLARVFEEAGDHRGLSDVLRLLGQRDQWSGSWQSAADLHERSLQHARAAGDERRETAVVRHIGSMALRGPEHVEPALARCRAILDGSTNGRVQASFLVRIGGLEGLAGHFDEARAAIADARTIMDDFGLRHLRAHSSDVAVIVAMLAGDCETAEREARDAYAVLEQMGDRAYQSSEATLVAHALLAQGRVDEAQEWLMLSRELQGSPELETDDLTLQALIEERCGRLDVAEELLRTAVERGGEIPVPLTVDPQFALAELLARSGRTEEARQAAEACLRRYEAKGIVPLTERTHALLATIEARPRR